MNFLRRILLAALGMMICQDITWAATPSKPTVTKQTASIKNQSRRTLGRANLVTTTANGRTSRVLSIKVANFTLPPGTKLTVKVNGTAVATTAIAQETDNYDVDHDGIPNDEDPDDDGDGIPDTTDPDDDGDGIPDTEEADADADGIPDLQDEDDDNDGELDDDEDADDDGIPDNEDPDDDNDGIPDATDHDDDGDGVPDEVDPDTEVATFKINVSAGSGVPAAPAGSTVTVTLPNGTVIASGKF